MDEQIIPVDQQVLAPVPRKPVEAVTRARFLPGRAH
jgi:hypothetical protein